MHVKNAWTTADELRFIARLGTHSTDGLVLPHHAWVERYRDTLALRRNWGAIDRATVQAAVEKALAG